jgi:hypothetical protein
MKGYAENTSDLSPAMRQIDETLIADLKAYIAKYTEKPAIYARFANLNHAYSGVIGLIASKSISLSKAESSDLDEIKTFVDKTRNKDTFSVMLDKLREEKGWSPSELYSRAGIDRRHWNKIIDNRKYITTKETIIKFGLALELSVKNMDALLETAGFVLSASSSFDLVIRYCLEHEIYNSFVVDQCLDAVCERVLYSA